MLVFADNIDGNENNEIENQLESSGISLDDGYIVRVLSICDNSCIVAIDAPESFATELFLWRKHHNLQLLCPGLDVYITCAALNPQRTLLAYGFTDVTKASHNFVLLPLREPFEPIDLISCQWTTSPDAYVNVHFADPSQGCDSLVVTRITNSLCDKTDPYSLGPHTVDRCSSLCIFNVFWDLDDLGSPVLLARKHLHPWEYDRQVIWYQFDRPSSIFYCLEVSPIQKQADSNMPNETEEHFDFSFTLSVVRCTFGQFQREFELLLPTRLSRQLVRATNTRLLHVTANDAVMFEHATLQLLDLGHGALCFCLQDNNRYFIFCPHWQSVLTATFFPQLEPARMLFIGLSKLKFVARSYHKFGPTCFS
eukprot:gene268-3643_t